MMTHSRTHRLARLEVGLRADGARLIELEQALIPWLQRGRGLGAEYGSPGDWTTAWGHHWDLVENVWRGVHQLVAEVQQDIQSGEAGRHSKALQTLESLQTEDARLAQTLSALHDQAVGLNATAQREWDEIAETLAGHLDVIHACAEALHITLELLKGHSRDEVNEQLQKLFVRLSLTRISKRGNTLDCDEEHRHAAVELQQEKNQFMGFLDVVRGMFTWVESTQERTDKNCLQGPF